MADSSLVEQLCRQAARLDEQALADLETTPLPPSAVHDCRVRAKRLRALWQLLRPWLCRDDHKLHDRTVRDGARALAGARDHYVMAATLQTLAGKADKPQRKALSRVSQTLFADNHPQPEPSHHQDAIAAFLA
ncbi:MAG: CHAD domain-containing protein, partial [Pseudomonadales bacterium]|nr:CHAD domain-containing protein [Pseudomonadales bacterium]